MLPRLIQRYDKKNHFLFDPVQKRETNWNFTGFQMSHFMIISILYINLLNLSWIKKKCLFFFFFFFEEYGAFKRQSKCFKAWVYHFDYIYRIPVLLKETTKPHVKKRTVWHVRRTKTIRVVWSESSLSAWRHFALLAIQNTPSEYSDQTARIRRLTSGKQAYIILTPLNPTFI